jgi:hypothetical protein
VRAQVEMIVATTAGKNFMHEGVDVDNPNTFSRPWCAHTRTGTSAHALACTQTIGHAHCGTSPARRFAWVNSLFAELMFVATGTWCGPRPARRTAALCAATTAFSAFMEGGTVNRCDQRNPLPAGSDPRMGGQLAMQGWWLAERGLGR